MRYGLFLVSTQAKELGKIDCSDQFQIFSNFKPFQILPPISWLKSFRVTVFPLISTAHETVPCLESIFLVQLENNVYNSAFLQLMED